MKTEKIFIREGREDREVEPHVADIVPFARDTTQPTKHLRVFFASFVDKKRFSG